MYAPEFIFIEIEKYSTEICEKSGKTKEELEEVLNILMRKINIIPKEEIILFIKQSSKISPDPKDVPYLALAMKLNIAI